MQHIKAVAFDFGNTLIGEQDLMYRRASPHPIPGVRETLHALRGQVILCVASNSIYPAANLAAVLEAAGLGGLFDHIVTSNDIGFAKPDRRFFDALLRMVNAQPRQCVMIGDSYHNDILGGREAGWHTVWYAAGRHISENDADEVITHMADAAAAVRWIDQRA